jgi:hypothetical protein
MQNAHASHENSRQLTLLNGAEPQSQHSSISVNVRVLISDRDHYDNYPVFQREFVWPEKFRRALIDSILRGHPIHPLLAYKAVDGEGNDMYQIADGHQRLSTIYAFAQGEFSTSTAAQGRNEEPNSPSPIEPGRYINELSTRTRNLFYGYRFMINVVETADEEAMGLIFRRVQHQLPLTSAEKLASYRSIAKNYALRLREHPLWENFYRGKDNRKETLQGSLYFLLLELRQNDDYAVIGTSRLHEVASGVKDGQMTPDFYEAILSRLEKITSMFDGTIFTHRSDAAIMYKAVMMLENLGYTCDDFHKGCLTSWFGQIVHEASQKGHGFTYPHAKIIENARKQQEFWEVNLPRVVHAYEEHAHNCNI